MTCVSRLPARRCDLRDRRLDDRRSSPARIHQTPRAMPVRAVIPRAGPPSRGTLPARRCRSVPRRSSGRPGRRRPPLLRTEPRKAPSTDRQFGVCPMREKVHPDAHGFILRPRATTRNRNKPGDSFQELKGQLAGRTVRRVEGAGSHAPTCSIRSWTRASGGSGTAKARVTPGLRSRGAGRSARLGRGLLGEAAGGLQLGLDPRVGGLQAVLQRDLGRPSEQALQRSLSELRPRTPCGSVRSCCFTSSLPAIGTPCPPAR